MDNERYTFLFKSDVIPNKVYTMASMASFVDSVEMKLAICLAIACYLLYDNKSKCHVNPNDAIDILQEKYNDREMEMFDDLLLAIVTGALDSW